MWRVIRERKQNGYQLFNGKEYGKKSCSSGPGHEVLNQENNFACKHNGKF